MSHIHAFIGRWCENVWCVLCLSAPSPICDCDAGHSSLFSRPSQVWLRNINNESSVFLSVSSPSSCWFGRTMKSGTWHIKAVVRTTDMYGMCRVSYCITVSRGSRGLDKGRRGITHGAAGHTLTIQYIWLWSAGNCLMGLTMNASSLMSGFGLLLVLGVYDQAVGSRRRGPVASPEKHNTRLWKLRLRDSLLKGDGQRVYHSCWFSSKCCFLWPKSLLSLLSVLYLSVSAQ